MLRPVVLLVLCATARRVFSWLIRSLLAVVDGREDLMDRGVLEAAELKMAFARLEDEKGGSITTVQDLLKWNIIGSAIKEGVVSLTSQFRFPWRSDRRLRHTATEAWKEPQRWSGGRNREGAGWACSIGRSLRSTSPPLSAL